jgi:hypothetical protein
MAVQRSSPTDVSSPPTGSFTVLACQARRLLRGLAFVKPTGGRAPDGSRTRLLRPYALAILLVVAAGPLACDEGVTPASSEKLEPGTWGGENAGVIVSDSVAHVHVGCTFGNFPLPIALDESGRFSVSGSYVLRAYPVAVGPSLPAHLGGVVRGKEMTLTIAVNDTVQKQAVVLGPITVTLGTDPKLGPCPICTVIPTLP